MNEIIIIHWTDCEVTWIPNTKDSLKFIEIWQESIDYFVMAEIPHQWKQYVKENKLLDYCASIAWDRSQDNPKNYKEDV